MYMTVKKFISSTTHGSIKKKYLKVSSLLSLAEKITIHLTFSEEMLRRTRRVVMLVEILKIKSGTTFPIGNDYTDEF